MKNNAIRLTLLSIIAVFILHGCKTETIKPTLSYTGTWNAAYTLQSSSFADNYKLYNWTAKLTINSDGSAQAVHQPGNPIFSDQQVTENLHWGIIDDHTMYLRSLNWSVTSQTMDYEVKEYGTNYIKMAGFDDLSQYWELVLRK